MWFKECWSEEKQRSRSGGEGRWGEGERRGGRGDCVSDVIYERKINLKNK